MNKLFKIFIAILIFLVVIIGIIMLCYIYNPTYDITEKISQNDIQNIMNKRLSVENVYIKHTREDKIGDMDNLVLYSEFFVKDNMVKVVETTESGKRKIFQENRDNGEVIWILEPQEIVIKYQNKMNAFDLVKGYDYLNLEEDVFSSETYTNLKYLGKTKINNRNVIAVLLERKDMVKEFIYIDEETGFILKHISKNPFIRYTSVAEIEVGKVTDDDVRMIDYESVYPNYRIKDM